MSDSAPQQPQVAEQWSVWRTDDNGNTFLMCDELTEEAAKRIVAEFEARGHKQLYFIEKQAHSPRKS